MKVFSKFVQLHSKPTTLTIGTFDGVHLGHQEIFRQMGTESRKIVVSFVNPPSNFFSAKKKCIQSIEHRLQLLENFGVDIVYLIDFTQEIAQLPSEQFLILLKQLTTFDHLVLGYDAKIGYQQEGVPSVIQQLADKHQFQLTYLAPVIIEDQIVSSGKIREMIQNFERTHLDKFLGRPYSICHKKIEGKKIGRAIGFPTINLDLEHLETPPFGVWICSCSIQDQIYPTIANLGFAPTLQNRKDPQIELHLLTPLQCDDFSQIEIFFHQYVRKEKKFSTVEELKSQISKDVAFAKDFFSLVE